VDLRTAIFNGHSEFVNWLISQVIDERPTINGLEPTSISMGAEHIYVCGAASSWILAEFCRVLLYPLSFALGANPSHSPRRSHMQTPSTLRFSRSGTFNVSPQPEISLRQSLRQGLSSKTRPVRTPNKAEGVGLCV
jgi:hypothetical protein